MQPIFTPFIIFATQQSKNGFPASDWITEKYFSFPEISVCYFLKVCLISKPFIPYL